MNWEVLAMVLSMSVVIERLLEAIGEPIIRIIGKAPKDVKRLLYLVIGTVAGWMLGANAFPAFSRYQVVGQIVTALLVGAGSQVIHAIMRGLQARTAKDFVATEREGIEDISEVGCVGRLG